MSAAVKAIAARWRREAARGEFAAIVEELEAVERDIGHFVTDLGNLEDGPPSLNDVFTILLGVERALRVNVPALRWLLEEEGAFDGDAL
jgi:hypothetical protein